MEILVGEYRSDGSRVGASKLWPSDVVCVFFYLAPATFRNFDTQISAIVVGTTRVFAVGKFSEAVLDFGGGITVANNGSSTTDGL